MSERQLAAEFPFTESCAYLNSAAVGPLPLAHVQAAERFLHEMSAAPSTVSSLAAFGRKADDVRVLAGALFRCSPTDVALLNSTTHGLALVPLGLDWHAGDEVVVYERDFPNIVYPWLGLRDRGVRIRFVPDRGGRFELADVFELFTDRTRVVSLALVNFVSGFRAPIEQIGRVCRSHGVWLLVDAMQAAGAIPVAPEELGADVLATGGYKHLLSGYGVGLCYCSARARRELRLAVPGWIGTTRFTANGDVLDYASTEFTADARRFEPSVPGLSGLWGTAESLRLIVEADPVRIRDHVHGLLDELVRELQERGYTIHSSLVPEERSTLLSVSPPGELDEEQLLSACVERSVAISIRSRTIRISPHLFNTLSDIDRLLDVLP